MTQSDAPNEGREEKPHGYTAGPKFPSMQWPSKSELPNHSEKLEAEIKSLRDQLSKERETSKGLQEQINNLQSEDSKHLTELNAEREMRKELVGYVIAYRGLASLTSDEDIFIGSLLKQASELDKT